jgi:hypothetical protein
MGKCFLPTYLSKSTYPRGFGLDVLRYYAGQYCSVSATNLTRGRVWGVWGVWGEIISSQFLLFPLFPLFPIPVSTDNLLNLTVLLRGDIYI